jgi:hypothetical protein
MVPAVRRPRARAGELTAREHSGGINDRAVLLVQVCERHCVDFLRRAQAAVEVTMLRSAPTPPCRCDVGLAKRHHANMKAGVSIALAVVIGLDGTAVRAAPDNVDPVGPSRADWPGGLP